jgi:inorganic pyrophosphatase
MPPVSERLNCIVEIPKGSRNKYAWDPELRRIRLDRFLFWSVAYPADFGYFPHTLAPDGDPLDAIVCVSEPTFPGCWIAVRAIALLRMHDEMGLDDKVLCVPERDPNWRQVNVLEDLPEQLRTEIAHFFSIYKQPEGLHVDVDGWLPRERALEAIDDAARRYRERTGDSDAR